ncbi:MAG TPA: hypothetical protein VGP62_09925 [Bryobacteraceae bacterium]|nr:hypothetical protein [Bryobacteraceae bacterium]
MKGIVLGAFVLVVALPVERLSERVDHRPSPAGDWLTTIAFPGERPIHAVATFSPNKAARAECWWRGTGDQFAVSFVVPSSDANARYRVTGTLKLDKLHRLRGPVTLDRLDSSGNVLSTVLGIAQATPIKERT